MVPPGGIGATFADGDGRGSAAGTLSASDALSASAATARRVVLIARVYGRAPQVGLRAPGYQPQDSRAAYAVARHRPALDPFAPGLPDDSATRRRDTLSVAEPPEGTARHDRPCGEPVAESDHVTRPRTSVR